NEKCNCTFLFKFAGGGTLSLNGLPATGNVTENSPANVLVYTFSVTLSPSPSQVASGYPLIINSNPLTEAFRIDPGGTHTYKVVTTGKPVLDYETMPTSFDLQIYVNDTAGASDLQLLTVQIIDVNEPPVFRGNMADQSKRIAWKHTAYNLQCDSSLILFLLNSYLLNITVTDQRGLSTTRTVIINIINTNDEAPYFTTVYRIPEEMSTGAVVANITAKDPDYQDRISRLVYSINPPNTHFSINPLTGIIYVATRIDREAAPLRLHPNISLVIRVEDSPSGGQTNEIEITVIIEDLNDNPPECNLYTFRLETYETATTGTVLLDLRTYCQDIDVEPTNNEFNFSGLSGLGSNKFTLEPAGSGRVVLTGNLDFENPANLLVEEYTLTVVVQDIAKPYYANNIYIYIRIIPVNEFLPVFNSSSYVFNVSEITRAGSSIGKVSATDKDLPFTGITYSIVAGGSTPDYTNVFWIDPNEGNLKIIASLDYETEQKFILTVQASDTEKLTTVTINVLEVNDEPPVCSPGSYTLSIPVGLTVGTNIEGFRIVCVDRDSSPRAFRYFINSGNMNNHFAFSPSAGSNISQLILASRFDYDNGLDTIWNYKLRVYITDDNLLTSTNRATALIETGTVMLSIKVIPKPTTTVATTPAITLLISTENIYSETAWYVPFLISIGSLLLLGLLGYLTFLLAKYIRTHFTGKMYEFNSKSGARRWKDTKEPGIKGPAAQLISNATTDSSNGKDQTGTPKLSPVNVIINKNLEAEQVCFIVQTEQAAKRKLL
uniref:Cadherin related family member 3 n=1 Tax=Pelusios castaneus TaxID=367368 RepID=A0A8C8RRS9_9SAUR